MKLVIIIPALNEEKTISKVIKKIPRKIHNISEILVFVIDDGCSDKTKEKALEAGADKVISNKKNLGLATTFKRGIDEALKAGADIIVNTDADEQYDQTEIPMLIKPILNKTADIVIGDRQVQKLSFMKAGNKYGNLIGSWILRKLTGTTVQDASSGFRAFSKEAALKINIFFNHTYTHETIIQAAYNDITIKNIPITFNARIEGESRLINGILSHIKNSSIIILRTILLYRPFKILFYLGILIMTPGIILSLRFLLYYFFIDGSGKIQSLILASTSIISGLFIIILGTISDLIANSRKINEKSLYYSKKLFYKR